MRGEEAHEKPGGLHRGLDEHEPREPPHGPRALRFQEQVGAELGGEDGVPAFHPDVEPGGAERGLEEMPAGKSAVAHIGEEIEQPEHARGGAGVVGKQRAGRGRAEQPHGGFHEVQRGLAGAAGGGAFHG